MTAGQHFPYHWRERLCHMLAIPPHPETMRLLAAWAKTEGGDAQYNPLNTTYPMLGATDYNSIGVKNYRTPVEGICATAATVAHDERYRQLWKDIQKGAFTAEKIIDRNEEAIRLWGTDIGLLRRVLNETA